MSLKGMMSEPIEFHFDFASPYGFLAAMQIDAIASRNGRTVTWRPFLLGAVYQKFRQTPLEHPLKRDYIIRQDAPRAARALGMELKTPLGFPEHSLPPARLFYWLETFDPAKAHRFAVEAYKAYWLGGRSTADAEAAADVAAGLGIERQAAMAAMNEPEIKTRVRHATDAAIEKGVFGSPFIFVDGEPFWGSDRLDQVSRKLVMAGAAA
jgi:2-hydroxychromene-2-carboxylate isomerase